MKFEVIVAVRYLKAKRKQAVISLITLISIIGVGAGVAALIIALAINAGFRDDLQKRLLGAQAHVSVLRKDRATGISDYLRITKEVEQVPGVVFARSEERRVGKECRARRTAEHEKQNRETISGERVS